mgnify:CR=1 FL=1
MIARESIAPEAEKMIKLVIKEALSMHILPIIAVVLAVLMLGTVIWGLRAKTEKYVTYGLVSSRILVFALLAVTIYMTLANIHVHPVLGVVRILWQFVTLFLMESAFRQKRQTL